MQKFFALLKVFSLICKLGSSEVLERIENFDHDFLTGLVNRRALEKNRNEDFTIVFLDLDHFKKINDEHGYQKGDEILQEFSRMLNMHSREEDVFSRWGGDEFLLILPKTKKAEAKKILKRIKKKARELSFPVSFSYGIVESIEGEGLEKLVEKASCKLQANKRKNRGAVL